MPSHDTPRATMEAPEVYPEGWRRHDVTGRGGWRIGSMLTRRDLPDGCTATFSLDTYPPGAEAPLGRPGRYRRLVISRLDDDRDPAWAMMRTYIRTCGLFDDDREVFLLLPPDNRYVTIRKSAFHWWQEDGERA